ncbi:MAG: TldD protein [Myxococcota bacterium]|jgi:TldD protein
MTRLTTIIAPLCILSTLACQAHSRTPKRAPPKVSFAVPAPLADDLVLTAMLAELERSSTTLSMASYDAPYFVSYTIKDLQQASIIGKLGAIYLRETDRTRNAYVDVRVGTYRFDSSEDSEQDWLEEGVYEPAAAVPVDANIRAIRHTLWLVTDLRYKQALASFLKLKGQRVYKTPDQEKQRPSFSKSSAVVRAEPHMNLTFDSERWESLVREAGAIIAKHPAFIDSEVSAGFQLETRWMVNTEGVRIRTVHTMFAFHAEAYIRADDGMLLDQSVNLYAPSEAGLPNDAIILAAIETMTKDLVALSKAPLLDPYTGPAILEPTATGVFFHEVLGHRLEGHRQDGEGQAQTFTKHLNKPILPTFLSVVDDPTRATYGDRALNGAYAIDDEGVAAQKVTLVDKGVLRAFLQARRPSPGFDHSNGHGRAQGIQRPVARMGNLVVIPHKTVSAETLKLMLLEEVRRQEKPFGLIIRDITGGSTNTSSYGYQAFKGEARMVYKVDAETGNETLVRGVDLVGTPLTTIAKIVAADDRIGVFNGYCGAESGMVPVSTVAPATLFSEIELQRSAKPRSKGPLLAPPGPSTANPPPDAE